MILFHINHHFAGKTTTLNAVYYVERGDLKPTLKWLREIQFQRGKPVRDSAKVIFKNRFLPKAVYGCLSLIASLGIIVAIVFLTFNIWFRKMRFYFFLNVLLYFLYYHKSLYNYTIINLI